MILFFVLSHAGQMAAQGKAEKDKIRIGYAARAVTHSLPFLTQEAGFFRDEGLQVEVVRTAGAVSPMALISGDTDFATMSAYLMIPVAARRVAATMVFPAGHLVCAKSRDELSSQSRRAEDRIPRLDFCHSTLGDEKQSQSGFSDGARAGARRALLQDSP
jgi:ABC-type nitrate/sulfonate/bicarbonate transport system substrate-binding protein